MESTTRLVRGIGLVLASFFLAACSGSQSTDARSKRSLSPLPITGAAEGV